MHPIDRRAFLGQAGAGFGTLALSCMLGADGRPRPARADLNGGLHHRAKAKRVVQLFMSGAASQCDTFDYKPELIKRHGQKFDPGGKVELFQSVPGAVMQSPWEWKQYGQCGKWISDLRAAPRRAASTTWRSSTRWSRSRTSTARRRSCRPPASSCPASPAWGRGSATASAG